MAGGAVRSLAAPPPGGPAGHDRLVAGERPVSEADAPPHRRGHLLRLELFVLARLAHLEENAQRGVAREGRLLSMATRPLAWARLGRWARLDHGARSEPRFAPWWL